MRKACIFAILLSLLTTSGFGFLVYDGANFGQAIIQVKSMSQDYSKQLEQLQTMANQLKRQAQMVKMQIQNLKSLKNYRWQDLSSILYRYRNILSKIDGIYYDAGNVLSQFEKIYKGSKEYNSVFENAPNQKARSSAYSSTYKELLRQSQDNFKAALKKLELQSDDFNDETAILQNLKSRSQSSTGALQVAQATNDLLVFQIDQIRKLRITLMDFSNMMATTLAAQNNAKILKQAKDEVLDIDTKNIYERTNPKIYTNWKITP